MMQRFAQYAAKVFPIRARVKQMQVPDLIDFIGRRYWMAGSHSQKDELLIFLNRTLGEVH